MKKLVVALVATAAVVATAAALLGVTRSSSTGAARANSTGAARANSTGAARANSTGAARASKTCTVTVVNGPDSNCGPYGYSPQINVSNGYTTYVGIGGWACGPASPSHPSGTSCGSSRLTVTDPGHWDLTTTQPKGNTGVLMYPSAYQLYNNPAIAKMKLIRSGFSESMPTTSGTVAWAAYDMFLNNAGSNHEVMIQNEMVNGCPSCSETIGHATFDQQAWTAHKAGGELIWTIDNNEETGTVDILSMIRWLITHGYVQPTATLGIVGYGWEICSTGGVSKNFSVIKFWLHTK